MTELVARPLVALVGRPNVGKSTLFNRLAGRHAAIVEDVPGVTRDRNYADCNWDGRELSVVDTGGFEPDSRDPLMTLARRQAQLAVDEAAAVVLVVDGREGLTSVDRAVADLLRRSGKPLFVAVNKVDTARTEEEIPLAEFYELGFGEVHALSAEHARGVGELVDAVIEKLALPVAPPAPEDDERAEPVEVSEAERPRGDIRLAIVGRPNVGKSTLVNALLGEERFVVSDVPGTTRDAIDSIVEHKGQRFVVTDTAGIRRKRSIAQNVEAYSVVRSMKAIDRAEVVACLLDATEAGVEQDARLLGLVAEKGKALVVVVNKWDVAEREGATQDWYRKELLKRLPFVAFAPFDHAVDMIARHADAPELPDKLDAAVRVGPIPHDVSATDEPRRTHVPESTQYRLERLEVSVNVGDDAEFHRPGKAQQRDAGSPRSEQPRDRTPAAALDSWSLPSGCVTPVRPAPSPDRCCRARR